jgi:predicted small lipoprotein YifL
MRARTTETAGMNMVLSNVLRALVVIISLSLSLSGCGGGGGGGSAPAAVNSVVPDSSAQGAGNAFAITSDNYGMENPTYLSSSRLNSSIVLRTAIASSMTDPNFKTVSRIDIDNPGAVTAGVNYSLGGAAPGTPAFAGNLYFFNGHQSTLLQTVGGTINFNSFAGTAAGVISGSFNAQVLDKADGTVYAISGNFSFASDSSGPVAAIPVPAVASSSYGANCASCHTLGSLDATQGSGPDLSLKGGKLNTIFTASVAGHQGITLAGSEISALKVLLNVN